MANQIENLVFEGGGVLGIAYLGALEYLFAHDLMRTVRRAAGTSAGAITACVASLNLPFAQTKAIADSLDFRKVPYKGELRRSPRIPDEIENAVEKLFGDAACVFRLFSGFGWYSTEYFYRWMQGVIAAQFDSAKKQPPYTFSDFQTPALHLQGRPFLDLSVVGTDLSYGMPLVFSAAATPGMEVAHAVRISMSIPLYFEAVIASGSGVDLPQVYCDGGLMDNYPIDLYDVPAAYKADRARTLGFRFASKAAYKKIDSLIDYIESLVRAATRVQQADYFASLVDQSRSVSIETGTISPVDFNVSVGDETYRTLYRQGYEATRAYFQKAVNP